MIALGLNVLMGLGFSAVVVALLMATAHQRTVRKARRTQDRETERRKYWGYV